MVDKNAQDQADYAAYVKDQKDKADYSAYVASQQPKDGDPSFLNDPGLKDDASDALKGYSSGAAFGMAPIMGGAIQAGLDMGQKGLNKLGLASPSPSQVGAKLKASGATGDIGATTSTDMLHQG